MNSLTFWAPTKTTYMILNSNVKSVLLYGSETWRTGRNTKRLQSFINRSPHYILGIKWYDKVTNECLWVKTGQAKIKDEIMKRKWRWIGNTLRKPQGTITRQPLTLNPQGTRKRKSKEYTEKRLGKRKE
jgi:hypothetical protein